jgi:hypothetical protein
VTSERIPPATAGALAESIAAATTRVPGVAGLSGGKFGQVATYGPGQKVNGVRFAGDAVEVHVVAEWVASLPRLADDVRTALEPLTAGRSVSVFVDDITQVEIPEGGVVAERVGSSGDASAEPGRLAWAKTTI